MPIPNAGAHHRGSFFESLKDAAEMLPPRLRPIPGVVGVDDARRVEAALAAARLYHIASRAPSGGQLTSLMPIERVSASAEPMFASPSEASSSCVYETLTSSGGGPRFSCVTSIGGTHAATPVAAAAAAAAPRKQSSRPSRQLPPPPPIPHRPRGAKPLRIAPHVRVAPP